MNRPDLTKTGSARPVPPDLPADWPYSYALPWREDALAAQVRQVNAAIDLLYDALFSPEGRARKDGLL